MNWIVTVEYEGRPAHPVRCADSLEEARELTADWLSHQDPDISECPVAFHFFRVGPNGVYELAATEAPETFTC